MKKSLVNRLVLLIAAAVFLASCGNSTREQAKRSAGKADKTEEPVDPEDLKEESEYLMDHKVLHAFSDPAKKDEFRIVVTGKSLSKGKVIFTITNSEGKRLLTEEFEADYLLGYEFEGNINSQKETDAFITKRIKSFFSEDHFKVPAIAADVAFEADQSYYIDKETWQEIKSDNQSIGFYYLLGKEDGRHIAFSKKKGKVVMYYNCC
ncbi:hypothetical protein D3C87_513480 [compost metagenome]